MESYKVIRRKIRGHSGGIFLPGDIVFESNFAPGRAEFFARQRFLERVAENKDTFKISIISAVWKRPEVFEMFSKQIKMLEKIEGIEIVTIIAGSEWQKSQKMVEKYGFKYIEIPNAPLAAKVNAPAYQSQFEDVDYVLCLGSDDLISVELMKYYIELMKKGYDFIGISDFYFYDTESKQAAYWGGYRGRKNTGHTCGAGRLISARLMKAWDWMPWENKHSLVLDQSIQEKLKATRHSSFTFSLKEKGLFAVDIKSSTNMTPFSLWDNTQFIDKGIILKQFPCVE